MGDKTKGLYNKYTVSRTDGRDKEGEKHHDCDYFVLDLNHDPCVPEALYAYAAQANGRGYEALATDLFALARRLVIKRDKEEKS